MKEVSFEDNVRVVMMPTTAALGLAGLVGQVYGETTPFVTGVEVVGETGSNRAISVQFESQEETIWFAPELLEFIDYAAGTDLTIGSKRLVRSASGEWVEQDVA